MDSNTELLSRLKEHDLMAFEDIVIEYSEDMVILAYSILEDSASANEVVTSVIRELWSSDAIRRLNHPIEKSLFSEIRIACRDRLSKIHKSL
jgi:DNA-directed RNA polymerase specialized sigma24 family protein